MVRGTEVEADFWKKMIVQKFSFSNSQNHFVPETIAGNVNLSEKNSNIVASGRGIAIYYLLSRAGG